MSPRPAWLFLVAVTLCPEPSRAGACDVDARWTVLRGTIAPAGRCGSYIATSDGARHLFSYGQYRYAVAATIPYRASITWQRLGADLRSLELRVLGATVLLGEEKCALYVEGNEARFLSDGWRPLPGYHLHRDHRVSVEQKAGSIVLLVDGKTAMTWPFDAPAASGMLSIGVKGAPGYRTRALLSDFQLAQ